MTLKNAALLAFIGMLLLSVLLIAGLLVDVFGVARGIVAPAKLLASFLHAFASVCLAVFFYVFHRIQS